MEREREREREREKGEKTREEQDLGREREARSCCSLAHCSPTAWQLRGKTFQEQREAQRRETSGHGMGHCGGNPIRSPALPLP